MAGSQLEVVNKEVHPQAANLVASYANNFAISLLLQAKLLAHQERAEVVINNHVDDAHRLILSEQKHSRFAEVKIAIGGALFGAFIQGFISELSLDLLRPLWIAVYTIAGFVGIFLIFWGLRR